MMKTREEQLQAWRERRGINRAGLKPRPSNVAPEQGAIPNGCAAPPLTEQPQKPAQEADEEPHHKRKASMIEPPGENTGKENLPAAAPDAAPDAPQPPSTKAPRVANPSPAPAQTAAPAPTRPGSRVPNFMAPTQSFKRHTARQDAAAAGGSNGAPGGGAAGGGAPTASQQHHMGGGGSGGFSGIAPRDSLAFLGLQPEGGAAAAGNNLLRERMSILRRESAAPGHQAPFDADFFDGSAAAAAGSDPDAVPCLEGMARHLFEGEELQVQCDRALTWQLKSSKEGATKDTRIQELAELTKLARRVLKLVLTNNKQYVKSAVAVQRQLEQEIEGLRLQQMSSTSTHEALKAEMARANAELAQAQNGHKQETVEMKLEHERLDAEVKRLGRALERAEAERDEARSLTEAAEAARSEALEVRAELEAALEAAERQRDQSLNAAAAARDVEMAATTRAREVEAAAADALTRATTSEAEASMAKASMAAAAVREETARKALEGKEAELKGLQAEHAAVLDQSQGILKDFESLQQKCNGVLEDLGVKSATLETVNKQLEQEEGKSQELTVQASTLRTELQHSQQQSSRLQGELEVKASTIERMAKQLAQQMDRCGSVQAEVSRLQGELEAAHGREGKLSAGKAALEGESERRQAEQRDEREEHEAQMEQIRADNAALQEAVTRLTGAEVAARVLAEEMRTDAEARAVEVAELKGEVSRNEESLAAAAVAAEERGARLAHLEGEMDALKEVAGIAADGGGEGDMVSALLSRVAALEAAAIEAHKERRSLHNALVDLRGNIRVFCRVRPLDPAVSSAVSCASDGASVRLVPSRPGAKAATFSFDKVFPGNAQQAAIFAEVSDLVQSALDGYNVCLFSYGQTGAGKTYTMQGSESPEGRGIIPRAVAQLLAAIQKLRAQGWEFSLEASFVEIYNETIRDLLQRPGGPPAPAGGLSIQHAGSASGPALVAGAELVPVASVEDSEALVLRAGRARAVEATAMNAASSRSHSIFTLHCAGANAEAGVRLTGALNLVDLAGSERLNRSKAEGARQKEACAINKSLSALGDVFAALASKSSHIPYRNSKLTHLLQPCLGGDGKTLMFVNINPEEPSADESLCSLKFASQVSQCETAAKGGAKRHVATLPPSSAATGADAGPSSSSAAPSALHRPSSSSAAPSTRRESLGAGSHRDSLALNGRSKVPLKRKAFGGR